MLRQYSSSCNDDFAQRACERLRTPQSGRAAQLALGSSPCWPWTTVDRPLGTDTESGSMLNIIHQKGRRALRDIRRRGRHPVTFGRGGLLGSILRFRSMTASCHNDAGNVGTTGVASPPSRTRILELVNFDEKCSTALGAVSIAAPPWAGALHCAAPGLQVFAPGWVGLDGKPGITKDWRRADGTAHRGFDPCASGMRVRIIHAATQETTAATSVSNKKPCDGPLSHAP